MQPVVKTKQIFDALGFQNIDDVQDYANLAAQHGEDVGKLIRLLIDFHAERGEATDNERFQQGTELFAVCYHFNITD